MKITVDCSKCDEGSCCTFEANPMKLPLRCTHCVEGKCALEEKGKPSCCAMYPVIIIGIPQGIFICVDQRCPEHGTIKPEDIVEVVNYYAEKEDLTLFTEEDVEFYGFDLLPIARVE